MLKRIANWAKIYAGMCTEVGYMYTKIQKCRK